MRVSIKISGILDPDQAKYCVGPNLGSNSFQMISTERTVASKELKKHIKIIWADVKKYQTL